MDSYLESKKELILHGLRFWNFLSQNHMDGINIIKIECECIALLEEKETKSRFSSCKAIPLTYGESEKAEFSQHHRGSFGTDLSKGTFPQPPPSPSLLLPPNSGTPDIYLCILDGQPPLVSDQAAVLS